MGDRRNEQLDPRAWIAWAIAAGAPALLGRNPWPLLAVLVAVSGVRMAWSSHAMAGQSWSLYLRLALIFAAISVIFNVLTVRAGDRVIATLPDALPLVGGEISLNAAVYGVLSGLALVTLVMIGSTVAGVLDWSAVVRLLPESLTTIAVAGSIAFALVPQTAVAYREIREAQTARGHRVRGARDLLPIIVPMIGGGLERAITLAEALESRAFGAPSAGVSDLRRWPRFAGAVALASVTIALYLLVSGHNLAALAAFTFASSCAAAMLLKSESVVLRRTRYRSPRWRRQESVVLAGAAIALVSTLLSLELTPATIRYEPYPFLEMPRAGLPLLAALLMLLAPAVVAPPPVAREGGLS